VLPAPLDTTLGTRQQLEHDLSFKRGSKLATVWHRTPPPRTYCTAVSWWSKVRGSLQESTTIRVLTVGSNLDDKQLAAAVDQGLKEAQASEDTLEPGPLEEDLPRTKPGRTRKAPTYSFVKDLNLRPDGQASLRQFYADKKPTDQQEKMTVILYYLYRTLEMQNVTTNHIYTGLKEVEERVPKDIAQALRNISNREGWVDSSDSDSLKTTVSGDNFVEHDLPAVPKSEDHDRG
jgi:hypothetical protein